MDPVEVRIWGKTSYIGGFQTLKAVKVLSQKFPAIRHMFHCTLIKGGKTC